MGMGSHGRMTERVMCASLKPTLTQGRAARASCAHAACTMTRASRAFSRASRFRFPARLWLSLSPRAFGFRFPRTRARARVRRAGLSGAPPARLGGGALGAPRRWRSRRSRRARPGPPGWPRTPKGRAAPPRSA
eukprot:3851276-Prymnesium_polylepis.1